MQAKYRQPDGCDDFVSLMGLDLFTNCRQPHGLNTFASPMDVILLDLNFTRLLYGQVTSGRNSLVPEITMNE